MKHCRNSMLIAQVLVNKIYMKYLIVLFLSIYSFIKADAQVTRTDTSESNLSTSEFKTLKSDYLNMLESDTYDQIRKSHRNINKKMNGLSFPQSYEDRRWVVDEEYTREWLALHIQETKFVSVDEAYKLIMKLLDLTMKQMDENKDMYSLLKRTSKEQRRDIFDIEVKWNQARLLE